MKPLIHSKPLDRTPAAPEKQEHAFTLVELAVVIVTVAILGALILPALARSGDNNARTVCSNNLRQLGTALNMYLTDAQDYLPWPNLGCDGDCPGGWLYHSNPNTPNNLITGNLAIDAANWSTGRVANLQTGVYWQYLQNPDVFICPVFAANVVGTRRWDYYNNKLSSYVMNPAGAFFPEVSPANRFGYRTAKASQIWSPLCIINWEPSGTSGNGDGYNDGANYPDKYEGPSMVLHATGANVLAVGGSTRFMSYADFLAEMNHPLKNDNTIGKGLLWWNPLRPDGHGVQE
jgi:type II secretory pathway pseudopilin PulG